MLGLRPVFVFEDGTAPMVWLNSTSVQRPFLPFAPSVVASIAPFQDSLTPC